MRASFHRRSYPGKQGGQAMAEYIYVFPILILLIMGAIQFGFIYQTKATLNYATFSATRQGALRNGSMSAIVDGLSSGLMPLFAHSSSSGGDRNLALLKNAWKLANEQVSNPKITTITIVNPTSAALSAYGSQSETGNEIPNDNLMYRPTSLAGGMSIQDANLLKVRVTYCYRMAVPIINKLIFHLVVDPPGSSPDIKTAPDILASEGGGATAKPCTGIDDQYRIPVTAEAVVRMQSPFRNPGKWVGP
ncbi:TadE/TadG family type IV pilus assembly protein [Paucimonas lemoignei]|nr:TadE family protein [Paucimonas lemoignei]